MRIHEALIASCFVFRLILCDPFKDPAQKTSRIGIADESKDENISNNGDNATFANENKIELENKTNAINDDEKQLPSFVWTSSVSLHAVYPDQVHDDISLQLADTVDGFIDCLFKGTFLQEAKAMATISGCQGDETTYITIFSTHLKPGQYMFSFDNNHTKEIANPYLNLRNDLDNYDDDGNVDGLSNRTKRYVYEDEDYEYEEEHYDDDVAYDSAVEPPPSPLTIKIKMAFDTSLVDFFGSEEEAKNYTIKVHEHGKNIMQNNLHSSLGTQIFVQLVGSPRYIRKVLEPKKKGNGLIAAEISKEHEPVPLIIAVATDDTDSDMGVSYTRKACDNEKGLAIFKRRENILFAVITYLHELSHLFGVRHDEQEDKTNGNNECTNTGIMSRIKPDFTVEQRFQLQKYSTCSSTRFANWYERFGKTCMIPGILNIDDDGAKCRLLEKKCKSVASAPGDILLSGCSKPKNIKNGIWSCSEDGKHCYSLCNEGYKLIHQSKSFIKCIGNRWNGILEDFRCTCDLNYKPLNAEPVECNGATCQVTCKAGYSPPLLTEMTCLEDVWSITAESLACSSNPSCQIPDSPERGMWLCKNGDCSCDLSCAEGYHPSDGREISYDLSQNEWSVHPNTFYCFQIPTPPEHGEWLCKQEDSSCELSCAEGFQPSDATGILNDKNQWSVEPNTLSCIEAADQVLLLTGGHATEKSVEVFDPEGNCNIDLPDLPVGRTVHTAHHIIKTGDVLICGAARIYGTTSCSKLVGQLFVHHSNLVEPRMYHSGVVLDNKIYLIGGMQPKVGKVTTSMESLTSPAATWSTENVHMEEGRAGACSVATSDASFLVIGGAYIDSEGKLELIEKTQVGKYNSTTQSWTTLAPMLGGRRAGHSCLYLGNGLVLVAGGDNGLDRDGILSSAEIYNINTNTWIATGSLKKRRSLGTMMKANGRVFIVGGKDELDTPLDSLEEFHPGSNSWTLLETRLKRPRNLFGATSVPKTYVGC